MTMIQISQFFQTDAHNLQFQASERFQLKMKIP